MDSLSNFKTIEELVKVLDREKSLFRDMFERRKSLAYRTDFALELVDYKRERIQFMIDHGVIHEQGDFLELEDVYVQFFEEVLAVNEEISILSVRECIDSIKENINYYLAENNENRKYQYQSNVRKILRKAGLRTLKNIIDLRRNVEIAYKQEPNYRNKKSKLVNLDEKRKNITSLMRECERLMERETVFFNKTASPEMVRTCTDVRDDFTEAYRNLLEIERQIIEYINQIDQHSIFFKKLRRLKYLKDQLVWAETTNVQNVVGDLNGIWLEKRQYNKMFLSLDKLRSSEDAYQIIRRVGSRGLNLRKSRTQAPPLEEEFLNGAEIRVPLVNTRELINAFAAQGSDLFTFIRNYTYRQPRTLSDHIILFCQIATEYTDRLDYSDDYNKIDQIEYALIYAKQHQ